MGVSVFTELAYDFGIVEFVVKQEMLRILIGIDFNLCHGVMNSWDLYVF